MRPSSRAGLIMLAVASLGWGSSLTLSAFALRRIDPTDLLAIELLTGGAVIWTVASIGARQDFAGSDWKTFAVLGLFEPGLTYLLSNEGLRRDSAATAALLFATEALVVVPFAAVFLAERVSKGVLVALGIGLLGAVIIGAGARGGTDTLLGHVLIFGSACSAATYVLLARRSSHQAPALVVTSYQLLAATVIAVPLAVILHLVNGNGVPVADLSHWAAAVAAGFAGVGLPFLLYNKAIVVIRATIAAGVLNLVPLVGFASAVLFLGNRPKPLELIGGVLVLVGAGWLSHSESRRDGSGSA